ncbi:protein phosphatase 2C domain-containing protein [Colwellia sp. MSW7]|jgi:protein phosphatase|uniref:Protein phosphatase 2C domain-containing protein n=1 Tax=Colwellia maritima TaxID=2912588 RepID=A0ABS9X4F2_9GAMM|nr:protein phosphatase 2C domain-containing protein [Colwellia maritima]MCI2284336.1 protein phosphatase 2C domain-containing protein [Colwellia maritima]
MYLSSHAQTHRGAVRKLNEDAFLELPQLGVWVVADGMGGHAAGDVASQLVIDTIQQAVESNPADQISTELLIQALQQSNAKLQQMSETQFAGNIVGSTVVVLWIKDDHYTLLWAGDSRGYLLRNHKLQQITKDHSQVNDMVDEGVLKAEEAESHPLANVITRAVGVDDTLNIDVKSAPILVGDVFLLCSDGLNKEVSDNEIEKALQPGNIIDAGMALMHASLVRNARDNVTCILVKKNSLENNTTMTDHDATIPVFT